MDCSLFNFKNLLCNGALFNIELGDIDSKPLVINNADFSDWWFFLENNKIEDAFIPLLTTKRKQVADGFFVFYTYFISCMKWGILNIKKKH